MEAYNGKSTDITGGRFIRGGACTHSGYVFPVSFRGDYTDPLTISDKIGGRIQLYIK